MKTKTRQPISPELLETLARQFADERISGLRGGNAWFQEFRRRG